MKKPFLVAMVFVVGCGPLDRDLIVAPTCPVRPASLCAEIPPMPSPDLQKVDGIGAEFCDVPSFDFTVKTMPVVNSYSDPVLDSPAHGQAYMAWSAEYLHAYVHVVDPAVIVAAGVNLWDADAVEVFLAPPTGGGFDGTYSADGVSGPVQVVMSPPAQGQPTRSSMFLDYTVTDTIVSLRSGGAVAGRMVSDGYEVELRIPWGPGTVVTQGATVAIDFAIDVQDDASFGHRQLQGLLNQNAVAGSSLCGVSDGQQDWPACDVRTWCTPTLQ